MRKSVAVLAAGLVFAGLVGCDGKPAKPAGLAGPKGGLQKLPKPELYISFGPECNVPDGMALDADQNIILSVPNFVDTSHPGKLMKLTIKDCKPTASVFMMLPPHPETGKVGPMALEFGPDGNLYVADNQYFNSTENKSRLLKVTVKDGKAVKCEVAADGLKLANAVRWKGNNCYVSDTFFDVPDKDYSGIWKFSLEEMDKGTVQLKYSADDPMLLTEDPHLFALIEARDTGEGQTAGADGMCFDSKGDLYTGNFGDGRITKVAVKPDGSAGEKTIIIDDENILPCCDGIVCDTVNDEIYITNSKMNAIHILDVKTNKMRKVWENDDDSGATGLLDQPCEPLLRGKQLIVVNFDMTFPGLKNQTNDEYNTLSVFQLD
ncbi:MAG: SMP-30/gluconolactonase/LRE family protein [Planctomycetota bacterium]